MQRKAKGSAASALKGFTNVEKRVAKKPQKCINETSGGKAMSHLICMIAGAIIGFFCAALCAVSKDDK